MTKTYTTLIFSVLFMFGAFTSLHAQNTTVRGTVTNAETGEPLPGANIGIMGTSLGTSTNADGRYSLSVPDTVNVLVFSFIGFKTKEVTINGRTIINVTLQPTTLTVGEELVVIGYGTQQKSNITGSVTSVSSEELTDQPALTATEALQGEVAGVTIIQNDAPGGTPTVIMRGLGTALGGRSPLYIVDGVPTNNINNIAPSDIKEITVLKDAASASIYGLRAANGVIIVTTKEGRRGDLQFHLDTYVGYTGVLNKVEMAGPQQYITYMNEANTALKKYVNADDTYQLDSEQPFQTDWYDLLLEPGYLVNTTASVSGGSENITYYLSYNLNSEEGILSNQNFRRQTIRNNNEYHLFGDLLTIDQDVSISFTKETPQPFSVFTTAYTQSPLVPVFYSNGRYGLPFVNTTTGKVTYKGSPGDKIGRLNNRGNPIAAINFNNQLRHTRKLQGKVAAIFDFTDYLTFTSRLGATRYSSESRNFNPIKNRYIAGDPTRTDEQFETLKAANPGVTRYANNSLEMIHYESLRWSWDNFVNLRLNADEHNFDITVGMSAEKVNISSRFRGIAYDVPPEEQYWSLDLASGDYEKQVNQINFTPNTVFSYFGRVGYNYDQRYYITGTLRRDGSSKFANTEDYYGLFPSVGIGWTISNEAFMSENSFFDYLKLRASWGKLGNQRVPFNTTLIVTSTGKKGNTNYVFGPDQILRFGAAVTTPARDITWEIIKEWNVGVDFATLNGRLSGNVDAYQKTTENVILQIQPIPDSQFGGRFFDHGGNVVNQGVEVGLNWQDNISNNLLYNIGFTFAYNKNEVTNVRTAYEGLTGGSLNNGQITKRFASGQPLGAWWMYRAIGVWQTEDDIANNPHLGGAQPGFLRYADLNEDGIIDIRDKRYFGSYIPKYTFGINIGLNYKRFDLSVEAYGVGGNKVYNGLKSQRFGGENITEEMFNNRWTGPGSTNEHPGAFHPAIPSTYYLEDGSYLRINNITIGYTLANVFDQVSSLRLYLSAENPFIFTGYSGFTPELIGNGKPYAKAGIELSAYPNTRTIRFGINIDFN